VERLVHREHGEAEALRWILSEHPFMELERQNLALPDVECGEVEGTPEDRVGRLESVAHIHVFKSGVAGELDLFHPARIYQLAHVNHVGVAPERVLRTVGSKQQEGLAIVAVSSCPEVLRLSPESAVLLGELIEHCAVGLVQALI
jgi:hypothetical protein